MTMVANAVTSLPEDKPLLLEMRSITKRFPGVLALSDVNFTLRQNEVVALVGENGAGKSTLMKILSGVYTADSGEVIFKGKPAHFTTPRPTGSNLKSTTLERTKKAAIFKYYCPGQ